MDTVLDETNGVEVENVEEDNAEVADITTKVVKEASIHPCSFNDIIVVGTSFEIKIECMMSGAGAGRKRLNLTNNYYYELKNCRLHKNLGATY